MREKRHRHERGEAVWDDVVGLHVRDVVHVLQHQRRRLRLQRCSLLEGQRQHQGMRAARSAAHACTQAVEAQPAHGHAVEPQTAHAQTAHAHAAHAHAGHAERAQAQIPHVAEVAQAAKVAHDAHVP